MKSSGHLHNADKGYVTSAREIASFFVPVSKKVSNSARWQGAFNAPGKELCQGLYLNKYVYSVNNERISVDPKLLINDLKPGEDEGEITWYPKPHFSFVKEESDEFIKGTFRRF